MRILFLHGWHSVPGGVKPTYLKTHGHTVINPSLNDDDFTAALSTAQAEFDRHRPDVIVGSSRGGAVAMNIQSGDTPLVLLCPAWKNWGTKKTLKPNALILHSLHDDVIPFADSLELITDSHLEPKTLLEVGNDHRLASPEALLAMLNACLQLHTMAQTGDALTHLTETPAGLPVSTGLSNNPIVELILSSRIVAILRLDDLTYARPLVEALLGGGVQAIEFTLTNPDAPAVIAKLRRAISAFDDGTAAIGIGSVRNAEEARIGIDAGSQFLVSPIALPEIVEEAKKQNTAVCLGAYTPTEIAMGWHLGADIIKVFPVRGLGPAYIRDVLAPMPHLRLMPTGGVDLTNLKQYLAAGAVAVGAGGKFVDPDCIRSRRWSEITLTASEYVQAARQSP